MEARGNERDKLPIMAGKRSFVWTYLKEDGHLRRYAHDSCSSTQGCHVGRKKRRIKEGLTTMRRGFLPSDPSPRRTQGFCHQILHYGPYAYGLPWACYLRSAASSPAYSAASSWTHLVPAPSRCPRPASLLLPFSLGPLEWHAMDHCWILVVTYPRFKRFLLLSYSLLSSSFPPPLPQSVIVSVLPFLHLPY